MAKDILAVYDACHSYIECFVNYTHSRHNLGFEVEGYTDLTILTDSLKNNKIKAVLLSWSETDDLAYVKVKETMTKLNKKDDMILFLLGEQPAAGLMEEDDNTWFIFKYQSMDQILADIRNHFSGKTAKGKGLSVRKRFSVSGIFSPIEKRSHPREAAILAGRLRKSGFAGEHRILYLNLEQFSGMKAWMNYAADTSISNVIYYYKTNPSKLSECLVRSRGSFSGMDVLTAPADMDDLEEIGKKGWPDFLSALSDAGDYPDILIDMSFCNRGIVDVVFEYGNLYIPALPYSEQKTAGDPLRGNAEKLKEFRAYITDIGSESWLEKILEIRWDGKMPEVMHDAF